MKMLKTMTALIAAVALSSGFASCSKDDDGTPGKDEITLDGANLGTRYAYYYIEDEVWEDEQTHGCVLYFWSYDMLDAWKTEDITKLPDFVSCVGIEFEVPVSQTDVRSVTLAPGEYEVLVMRDISVKGGSNGWEGVSNEYDPVHDTPLVIKKDGSNYTVTFSAKIYGRDGSDKDLKFNYSGPITLAPANIFE